VRAAVFHGPRDLRIETVARASPATTTSSSPSGDDAYYLNALAGDRRTMACSFDPDLDWVRATWPQMAPDPRVPLVSR